MTKQLELADETPDTIYCAIAACPAIFKSDSGTYVIIGRVVGSDELSADVNFRIGKGEVAIEVPSALVDQKRPRSA
jgi:hypothetical protein